MEGAEAIPHPHYAFAAVHCNSISLRLSAALARSLRAELAAAASGGNMHGCMLSCAHARCLGLITLPPRCSAASNRVQTQARVSLRPAPPDTHY